MRWPWRRPAALLVALLLALDAALGAGTAAPHAEHALRAPAAAAIAVRTAANASSQCSGTTSPYCRGEPWTNPKCSTSSDLTAAGCNAWVDLFDSTGGAGWNRCSQYRLDPCACDSVKCEYSHIISLYARGSFGPDGGACSRPPPTHSPTYRRRCG